MAAAEADARATQGGVGSQVDLLVETSSGRDWGW
jgi:hypothetical protein